MRRRPWRSLLVILAVLAAGCATPRVAYTKPGATDAERKRDEAECVQQTLGHDASAHVAESPPVDREVFRSCLEQRGYVPVR